MDVGRYFSTQSCVLLMVSGAVCGGLAAFGHWRAFWALRARRLRNLQRALVIYGLLCCASYTVHQYRRLRADGVLGLIYRI